MKKKKKRLNLGKLTISHLEGSNGIKGGNTVTCGGCPTGGMGCTTLPFPTKCFDTMCNTFCATYDCSMCPACEEPDL
jgi:hypothetical protein